MQCITASYHTFLWLRLVKGEVNLLTRDSGASSASGARARTFSCEIHVLPLRFTKEMK